MLDLLLFIAALYAVAALCSLAHVLIIPEGTLGRKRPRD